MKKEPENIITQLEREPEEVTPSPAQLAKINHAKARNAAGGFPVVGIGASAGGVSALEKFFKNMPAGKGIAFVVITHLDPDKKGMMPEVLQSFTDIKVVEIADGLRLKPDHIYVIPPNKDISLLHSTFLLLEPLQQRGLRLPIDHFLTSLAKDQRENAICIILSGMGSDGTIGLKMIMENFGLVMVQDPETAEFDSMPKNAIETGFADFILPPEKMAAHLVDYTRQFAVKKRHEPIPEGKPQHSLQKIYHLIRNKTGHDFSLYKRNTVYRRIERRMQSHQIAQVPQYVRYLQEHPEEIELLFRELLIGVTKFFRDHEAFDLLKNVYLPPLVARIEEGGTFRVWVAGCSSGEEAYSIAILLQEILEKLDHGHTINIQVFATDIDEAAIAKARMGIYQENIVADVSPDRLKRFFQKTDNGFQIKKEVRELVVFAVHNLTKDAPFTKLDLLCCRNLLIYLSSELQNKLIPVFHYALNPHGILFLGSSETFSGYNDFFVMQDTKWKIFERSNNVKPQVRLTDFSFSNIRVDMPKTTSENSKVNRGLILPNLVQKILLEQYVPPSAIVTRKGEIIYINGHTGRYLEPATGMASMNIFEMAREGLKFELNSCIYKASLRGETVVCEKLMVKNESGEQPIRLTVKPLTEPEPVQGLLLVVFEDITLVPTPAGPKTKAQTRKSSQVQELEKELEYTRQRLQSTIEEMQASFEELQSANEELQSANEELQSTNEETMTNKEEMQSLNEELLTINAQYQAKAEELIESNNDMKNLLDSTEIATIFLDNELRLKNFTPQATQLFNIIRTDIGRSITDISSRLQYDNLARDVNEVLLRLASKETEVATTDNKHWYSVRILPYRTTDNFISGAVLTITSISRFKELEQELEEERDFTAAMINAMRDPLIVLDENLKVAAASNSFCEAFRIIPAQIQGHLLYHLGNGQWDIPALRGFMEKIVAQEGPASGDLLLEHDFPVAGFRKLMLNARKAKGHHSNRTVVVLTIQDITGN